MKTSLSLNLSSPVDIRLFQRNVSCPSEIPIHQHSRLSHHVTPQLQNISRPCTVQPRPLLLRCGLHCSPYLRQLFRYLKPHPMFFVLHRRLSMPHALSAKCYLLFFCGLSLWGALRHRPIISGHTSLCIMHLFCHLPQQQLDRSAPSPNH